MSTLAIASGFDVEDVIIELVRLGLLYAIDPRAQIRSEDLRVAMRAVGLSVASDERKRSFWAKRLRVSDEEFDSLLQSLGFGGSRGSKFLPKNAHSKLLAYEASLGKPKETLPASPSSLRNRAQPLPKSPRATWQTVGQKRVSQFLTADDILMIHQELESDAELASDPIFPPGVKSHDMVESACLRPQSGVGETPKYPTVEMAAAALVHSLVSNHAFHNGNKRTALVAMMVFLDRNNHWLKDTVKQDDLYLWVLEIARHQVVDDSLSYDDLADWECLAIAEWIRKNSRSIERSERPITWRDLRNLLVREYGCTVEQRAVGGKYIIRRSVSAPSWNPLRGFRKTVDKTFVLTHSGDGKEVGLGTVKSLRLQLGLTEDFNIDSAIFYGSVASPDQFISRYQRLLRNLARV